MKWIAGPLLGCVFFLCLPLSVSAVTLHYGTGKTYGVIKQNIGIEVSASIDSAQAQSVARSFAGSGAFFKVAYPDTSFPGSASMKMLDTAASRWYLTVKPGDTSVITSFLSQTSKPLTVEVVPFDAAFVRTVKSQFPQVSVHAGGYLFWPREDIRNALSQVAPPILESVSIYVEESSYSNIFSSSKLMFDTFFDASNDIAGTSNVKINYPSNTTLALSGIRTKGGTPDQRAAWRMSVAADAAVTSVQTNKSSKAPIQTVSLGAVSSFSQAEIALAAGYARFVSAGANIIWPMSMGGNGDPYDNTYLSDSNSKPVMGVLGTIQGQVEGVLVNASGQSVSVALNEAPGKTYSSQKGQTTLGSDITLAPYETVVFGSHVLSASPPPVFPTSAPTSAPSYPTTPPPIPTAPRMPTNPPPMFPTSPPSSGY